MILYILTLNTILACFAQAIMLYLHGGGGNMSIIKQLLLFSVCLFMWPAIFHKTGIAIFNKIKSVRK